MSQVLAGDGAAGPRRAAIAAEELPPPPPLLAAEAVESPTRAHKRRLPTVGRVKLEGTATTQLPTQRVKAEKGACGKAKAPPADDEADSPPPKISRDERKLQLYAAPHVARASLTAPRAPASALRVLAKQEEEAERAAKRREQASAPFVRPEQRRADHEAALREIPEGPTLRPSACVPRLSSRLLGARSPGRVPCACRCSSREEFKDLHAYLTSVAEVGNKFGAVRIVPPASWRPPYTFPFLDEGRFPVKEQVPPAPAFAICSPLTAEQKPTRDERNPFGVMFTMSYVEVRPAAGRVRPADIRGSSAAADDATGVLRAAAARADQGKEAAKSRRARPGCHRRQDRRQRRPRRRDRSAARGPSVRQSARAIGALHRHASNERCNIAGRRRLGTGVGSLTATATRRPCSTPGTHSAAHACRPW
jgi:hypothetical protein